MIRARPAGLLLAAFLGAAPAAQIARAPAPPLRAAQGEGRAEAVDALVARGRALIEAHQGDAAAEVLEQASTLDGGSFRTQVWLLRAWLEQGRNGDTLDALDALRDGGHSGAAMDYLYGMAFALRGREEVASGVRGDPVRMNFEDAVERLSSATAADPEEYGDGFLPLAAAAWYLARLEVARDAVEKAVQRRPRDPAAQLALGRIAASQFQAETGADADSAPPPAGWNAAAETCWRAARKAFESAVQLAGAPGDDQGLRAKLVDAATQLGHLLAWKRAGEEASDAYGTALAWGPDSFPYHEVRKRLAVASDGDGAAALGLFRRALEHGERGFASAFDAADPRGAKLLWWLGWSEVQEGAYDHGIAHLERSVAEDPSFANAWHHVGIALWAEKRMPEAIDAFVRGWRADPNAMLAEMKTDPARLVGILEQLIVLCVQDERFPEAAALAEMCGETQPKEPRHWSNMGLFLRRVGERLRDGKQPPDATHLREIFTTALGAYERALGLTPNDPQLLNDAAVVIDRDLHGDLERAAEMYRRAVQLADRELKRADLPADERARFSRARDDATANLRELGPELERRAAQREAGKAGAQE